MNIIKDMYYGNVPSFIELNPHSEAYDEKIGEILMLQDEIIKKFPDIRGLLEKYFTAYRGASYEYEFLQFQMGVRVGAQLMLDMMKEIDE